MKILKSICLQLLLLPALFAQTCEEPIFIKDNTFSYQLNDSVSWFKFKAKGGNLQLLINSVGYNNQLSYQVYKAKNCDELVLNNVLPVRNVEKGVMLVSKELWDFVEKNGHCVCDHCLAKVHLSQKNTLQLQQEEMYLIKVNHKEGDLTLDFTWSAVDVNKKKFAVDATIQNLEVGMIYQLKTVQFAASSVQFTTTNIYAELDSLFTFLQRNSSVNVEVIGHVNGPFNTDPIGYQKLSEARAKKIMDYLVEKGIDNSRIFSTGKGNEEMIYASPKQEWQAQENRRVVVVIRKL